MAAKLTITPLRAPNNDAETAPTAPEKLPHRLDTGSRVRREVARVYRLARPLAVDVSDYSKLAHVLALLHRMIESGEIERRVEALEQRAAGQ